MQSVRKGHVNLVEHLFASSTRGVAFSVKEKGGGKLGGLRFFGAEKVAKTSVTGSSNSRPALQPSPGDDDSEPSEAEVLGPAIAIPVSGA
eukprot:scaffold37548_cov14-Tisochrysis_lutea.AAC.1